MTEFKPNDQPGVSTTLAAGQKKGGRKRRTKREDMNTVSNALGSAANTIVPSTSHAGTHPLPEDSKPAPRKQWPCLVPSSVYNPDYPTFCECLQLECSHHSPSAKDLLLRSCTAHSWPPPGITSISDASAQEGPPGDLNVDPMSSPRLPSSTVQRYAQVVPELASILDHMEREDPMLILSTTDASMDSVLPFQLPPKYGCVVLGFFNVESVEVGSAFRSTSRVVLTFFPESSSGVVRE